MAMYRSRMGGTLKRAQPTREHLRRMGSAGDIFDNLPKEVLGDLDKPLDDGSSQEPAAPVGGAPAPDRTSKEVQHAPVPQPKPKPRAAPRKKPQPTPPGSEDGKEIMKSPPPQAAPRSQAQTAANLESPRASVSNGDNGSPANRPTPGASPKHVPSGDKISPVKAPRPLPTSRHPNVGPKPPAKSKSPVREPGSEDGKSPSRSRTCSLDKEGGTELEEKDPSQMTIKEKAMMAQKAFLPTPSKPAPPVARRPKPSPGGVPVVSPEHHTEEVGAMVKRAQSLEDMLGVSPPNRRKLPPGAFNIMGAVPMFGPGSRGSADRGRSATVSASLDRGERERGRGSVERQLEEEQGVHVSADGTILDASEKDGGGEDDTDQATPNTSSAPPDVSPDTPRKHSIDELTMDSDPLSNSDSPQAPSKFEHAGPLAPAAKGVEGPGSADVDLDVVLAWSPEVTAAWISSIGLSTYQQMFIEKEIQGYMLFDLDGHKLKVLSPHAVYM